MRQHSELSIATQSDLARLTTFDYTKLTAINMCPTWGIIRYGKHKAMSGGGRAMALEAGTVMHECFAAIRLVQVALVQKLPDHADAHGVKQFGAQRWNAIRNAYLEAPDTPGAIRNAAMECLLTSGYVDDPLDKFRTINNLETSLLYYAQRWDPERYPVYISDPAEPAALIGVEIPFAIKVSMWNQPIDAPLQFIYTGRIDGLHVNPRRDNELIIQENKTAARLNDAWVQSFDMSHQVTGYTIAASLIAQQTITRGLVLGVSIPLPRDTAQGLSILNVQRPQYMKERWLEWVEHTVGIYNQHINTPLDAPRYTHSCNRYFRPCSMIPMCAVPRDEQEEILAGMEHVEWSPLHERGVE